MWRMHKRGAAHPVNLRLIRVCEGGQVVVVLLVLRVEVVNDLGELRNLLAHLVVQVREQILIGRHGCEAAGELTAACPPSAPAQRKLCLANARLPACPRRLAWASSSHASTPVRRPRVRCSCDALPTSQGQRSARGRASGASPPLVSLGRCPQGSPLWCFFFSFSHELQMSVSRWRERNKSKSKSEHERCGMSLLRR